MASTTKLIAKETIKYGPNGETAEPGETFDCPSESVDQLLELGHAERPAGPKGKSADDDSKGGKS